MRKGCTNAGLRHKRSAQIAGEGKVYRVYSAAQKDTRCRGAWSYTSVCQIWSFIADDHSWPLLVVVLCAAPHWAQPNTTPHGPDPSWELLSSIWTCSTEIQALPLPYTRQKVLIVGKRLFLFYPATSRKDTSHPLLLISQHSAIHVGLRLSAAQTFVRWSYKDLWSLKAQT